MNLQTAYDKLYKHWLKEYQSSELTPLSQESYENYQEDVQKIKEFKSERGDEIKTALTKTYQENIEYLLIDLLKMREIKLINSALAFKAIDVDLLIEAEKLLYQNLVASFKGYDKTKKLSNSNIISPLKVSTDFESGNQIPKDSNAKKETPLAKQILKREKFLDSQELQDQAELSSNTQYSSSQIFQDPKEEDYNYVLVRFLKNTPPIVGLDLLNYGPYEKEDIASLPYKNAKILMDEEYAALIDLTTLI